MRRLSVDHAEWLVDTLAAQFLREVTVSRSKKDGRKGGAHFKGRRATMGRAKEINSPRCRDALGSYSDRYSKRLTHRFERRQGRWRVVEE